MKYQQKREEQPVIPYNSPVNELKIYTVILPPTTFHETMLSPQYMSHGLLGFTYGNKDIHIRSDAPDYGFI